MTENEAQSGQEPRASEEQARPVAGTQEKSETPQKPKSVWTEVVNQSLEQLKEKIQGNAEQAPGKSI